MCGFWSRISNTATNGFKAGKKFLNNHSGTIATAGLTAVNPIAGAAFGVANSKFGRGVLGKLWNAGKGLVSKTWEGVQNLPGAISNAAQKTWEGVKKAPGAIKEGWNKTKDFTSKHADTIGNVAAGALSALHPALGVGVGMLANHFANDNTGWGRLMKGLARGTGGDVLASHLQSQSNASNESNGHVAAGYSISSTGNNTKPTPKWNGQNRKKSWVL